MPSILLVTSEERVVVFDEPGTTRDSVYIPFERNDKKYTLIDTAGMRRRAKVTLVVEKFSIIKALQSVEKANVVIYLIDASEGITDQDAHLLGMVLDAGRALSKTTTRSSPSKRLTSVDLPTLGRPTTAIATP
jgi:predicted GTPase